MAHDLHAAKAKALLAGHGPLAFSSWSVAEVSSGLALRFRRGDLTALERKAAERELDKWLTAPAAKTEVMLEDFLMARGFCRDERLIIRASDALHLAVVQRTGCALATFDDDMAKAAHALGIEVVDL